MKKEILKNIVERVTSSKSMGGFSLIVKDGQMTAFASSAVFMSLIKGKTELPDMDINVMTDKITGALDVINSDDIEVVVNKSNISIMSDKTNVDNIPLIEKRNEIPIEQFKEDGFFYYKKGTIPPNHSIVFDSDSMIVIDNKQLPDISFGTDKMQLIFNNDDPTMYKIENKLDVDEVKGDGKCTFRAEIVPLLKTIKSIGGKWKIGWLVEDNKSSPVSFSTEKDGVIYQYLLAQIEI